MRFVSNVRTARTLRPTTQTIPGHNEEKYRAEEVKGNVNISRAILRRCEAGELSLSSKKPHPIAVAAWKTWDLFITYYATVK